MKPPRSQDITDISISLRYFLEQLAKVVGGNISFGSTQNNGDADLNMEGWKAFGTTPPSNNTDFTITHGLNRIPIGWLTLYITAGTDPTLAPVLFRSATAWTKTTITLQCFGASCNYFIFII